MIPTTALAKSERAALEQLAEHTLGLRRSAEFGWDIDRAVRDIAREAGFGDARRCARWLRTAPLTEQKIAVLAAHFTVGETYFFRDRASFRVLAEHVVPGLYAKRRDMMRRLRFWSAGCATGDELYSIAMVLRQSLPDLPNWDVTLLGTDVNKRALRSAIRGVFSEWSFRQMPSGTKRAYFSPHGARSFELRSEIRRMAQFRALNLAHFDYPSVATNTHAMDVIFCRNVLMYLDPVIGRRVVRQLSDALVDGGWLFVAPAELALVDLPQLVAVELQGCIVYRKGAAATRTIAAGAVADLGWGMPKPFLDAPVYAAASEPVSPLQPPAAIAQADSGNELNGREAVRSEQRLDASAAAHCARWAADRGRPADAYQWCRRAIESSKFDPSLCYLCATICSEQGDLADARYWLRRALYLNPGFVPAHVALGYLSMKSAQHRAALRHFGNALWLLHDYPDNDVVPDSDGLTAGRLSEVVRASMETIGGKREPV